MPFFADIKFLLHLKEGLKRRKKIILQAKNPNNELRETAKLGDKNLWAPHSSWKVVKHWL